MGRFACIGICAFFALAGCVANSSLGDSSVAEGNVSNLSRISLGMKETQVLKIMHTPYKQESYRVGCDRYHVWFYVTTVTAMGQSRMVPINLTPLTFRNCKLVGVGYSYYRWLQERNGPVNNKGSFSKDIEDKQLENTLEKSLKPGSKPENKPGSQPGSQSPSSLPANTSPKQPPQQSKQTPSNTPSNTKSPPPPTKPPKSNSQPPQTPQSSQQGSVEPDHNYPGAPTSPDKQPPTEAPQPNPSPSYNYGPISMSKPPKKPPPKKEAKPDDKPEWNEEDEQKIEEESEQNFNFW